MGKRLPDLLDLHGKSGLSDAERTERREYYGQAVLICFYPFRCIEDLRNEGQSWWDAFLEREDELLADPKTTDILKNLQEWHESFCRASRNTEELHLHVEQEIEDCEEDKGTDEESEIDEDEAFDQLAEEATETTHHLVDVLSSLGSKNPLKLKPIPEKRFEVSSERATQAIQDMPKKRSRNSFVLPTRAKLGNQENPGRTTENDAILDDNCKTPRVDLMENLAKALRDSRHLVPLSDGNEPEVLEPNFPSIQEHSQHWTLNEKQHASFTLSAAALLKHIWTANEQDPSVNGYKFSKLSEEIKIHLSDIFNNNEQLIMYLGGAGGTGKSRVVQALVDFARRWHSSASVVITASTGIAAVLVGGCTVHCALGVQLSMNPPKPSRSQCEAWSEVGVLFIDEFSMIKQHFFDMLDTRLKKLKDRPDLPFGGVHLILR